MGCGNVEMERWGDADLWGVDVEKVRWDGVSVPAMKGGGAGPELAIYICA